MMEMFRYEFWGMTGIVDVDGRDVDTFIETLSHSNERDYDLPRIPPKQARDMGHMHSFVHLALAWRCGFQSIVSISWCHGRNSRTIDLEEFARPMYIVVLDFLSESDGLSITGRSNYPADSAISPHPRCDSNLEIHTNK